MSIKVFIGGFSHKLHFLMTQLFFPFHYFLTTPPDSCHHAEHQNQGRVCVSQSPDGGTHGHVEPDPGPLGLHPVEEGRSEEVLHVVQQLLGPKVSQPAPLAAQRALQLGEDQQLVCHWPV